MGAYSQRLGFAFAHVRQRRTFVPRVALLPLAPQIKQWLLMRPHHLMHQALLALAVRAGVGACAPRGAQEGHCGSASATNPPLLGFLPGLGQTIVRRRARYDVLRSGGRDTPSEMAGLHGRHLESRVAMRAARSHPAPRVPSVPTPTLPTLAVPDCVAVSALLHGKLDFGGCMESI